MNRASSATGWARNPDGTLGWTLNPITGCLNHRDGLCKGGGFPCYAYRLANGRLKQRYLSNPNVAAPYTGGRYTANALDDPFYPRFWPGRLVELMVRHTNKNLRPQPIGVFVCDMGELFGDWVPEEWTRQVLAVISKQMTYPALNDRFYLLTKQPQNLAKFSPFPDNCWVGVTATDTEMLMQACSYLEYPVRAKLKYLSIEPFLEWSFNWNMSYLVNMLKRADIGWIIIGAQTKPYKPPKIEWVEEIAGAADKAGVPVFLKDNLLELLPIKPPFFIDPGPGKTAHYRQEMPDGK